MIFCEIAARPLGDMVSRDSTGQGAVIVPGRSFEELLSITCGLIRRFSGREPTVLVALLRMLATCAEFVPGDDVRRLQAIDEQAALILSQGKAEIAQPLDLAQVQATADPLRQRITDRLATPPA